MHFAGHALSALPFAATGHWTGAVGCMLPDVAWLANEARYRLSSLRPWQRWASAQLVEQHLVAYRWTHSLLTWALVAAFDPWLALGAALHIVLDLPTHGGLLTQRPLYPINWRWPWPRKE